MKISKNIVIGVLSILGACLIAWNINQRVVTNKVVSASDALKTALDGVVVQRDSIADAYAYSDSLLSINDKLITEMELALAEDSLRIKWLEGQLADIPNVVDNMLPDSVYIELKNLFACLDTNDIYAFSEGEIYGMLKEIRRVFGLEELNIAKDTTINNLKVRVNLAGSRIAILEADKKANKVLVANLIRDKMNLTEQDGISKQEVIDITSTLRKWQIGALSSGAAVLLILILL
jgi:hypothetical protein